MHPKKQIQNGKSAQGVRTIRLEKIIPAAALLTILGLAAPDPSLFCSHSLFQSPKLGLLFTTIVPAIATITSINEDP